MANTTKAQFQNLISVYEKNENKKNEEIINAFSKAEPSILKQTLSVYRSVIENYKIDSKINDTTSSKFKEALEEKYKKDNGDIETIIKERDELKSRVIFLENRLSQILDLSDIDI